MQEQTSPPAQFADELRDLLAHLFDPAYSPSPLISQLLGRTAESGEMGIHAMVLSGIDRLKPAANVPYHARAWRLYQILTLRYLEQLSQAEAAELLAVSVRHLAREQAEAIDLLARELLRVALPPVEGNTPHEVPPTPDEETAAPDLWRQQVVSEIASFQKHAITDGVDLRKALDSVRQIAGVLAAEHNVTLRVGPIDDDLVVDVHPAILSQILLAPITYLVRGMTAGVVEVRAQENGSEARIVVTGTSVASPPPPAGWLVRDLLASQGGSLRIDAHDGGLTVEMTVPLRRTRVLIVDDNEDLVYLYRRCLTGSRYNMASLSEGSKIFEEIEAIRPDVIVLDLMLPDVDGWQLLAELHEHPASRDVPLIVCSVVREEDLALALGATAYLPKPVQCQQLIAALDQAMLTRALARDRQASGHSA